MNSPKLITLLACLGLVLGCSRGEPTGAQTAAPASAPAAPAEPKLMTAVYQVPGLDEELVKKITAALAEKPGVVSARPDAAAGTLQVTYATEKISLHSLLQTLQGIQADISPQGAAGAASQPAGHDCGGCPYRNTCQKQP